MVDHLSPTERDKDHLGKDLAGLETGLIKRGFGVSENSPTGIEKKKAKERERDARTVWLLQLASQEDINAVLRQLDDLQERLDEAFAELEQDWEELDSRTVRLEDGTAVYLTEDGQFSTLDGRIVDASELPDDIPANAATLTEAQILTHRGAKLSGIQTDVIDHGRDKVTSGDATNGDVEDIKKGIDRSLEELNGNFEANQSSYAPLIETSAPVGLILKTGF